MNPHLFAVDESLERELRDQSLDGKHCLLHDMRRGHHAKVVVSEINHARALKAVGEQKVWGGDAEMRLTGVIPASAFHLLAVQEGTYDVWDLEQSDMLDFIRRRHPENNIRVRSNKTLISVGNKYGPPSL